MTFHVPTLEAYISRSVRLAEHFLKHQTKSIDQPPVSLARLNQIPATFAVYRKPIKGIRHIFDFIVTSNIMGFGFGVGDVLAVLALANAVRQKWVDAPAEYASIREQ